MNKRQTLRSLIALGMGTLTGAMRAGAQQPAAPLGARRLGILMGYAENDPEAQLRLAAFKQKLATLGWVEGRNLTLDLLWTAGDADRAAPFAKQLVALKPDAILSNTTPNTTALQRETSTIPIVFTAVSDPVGSGFVKTLARPGGNITGFINLEASLIEKWLELLKEIAPRVKRVGVMYNPKSAPYANYYLQRFNAVASKFGVTAIPATVSNAAEIEKVITTLARPADGGLIMLSDSFMTVQRKTVIALAARHKVPAIYYVTAMAEEGGLIAYGINYADMFRNAAPYVDRILRGAKPADLPVQQPTLYELAVNLKTAKALGLKVPHSIFVRAERVIE